MCRDDEILYVSKEGDRFLPVISRNFGSFENQISSEWVRLNVGGQVFQVSKTTLLNREPDSFFSRMFDPDSQIQPSCFDPSGAYLIDREAKYFSPLINYLRTGRLIIDPDLNIQGK